VGGTGISALATAQPYLLDTHIWFWYLTGSDRLPAGLRSTIGSTPGRLWISPISLWELGILEQRGRVRLDGGFRAWTQAAHQRFPLQEASLTREVAVRSCELDLPHRDPADRFLAATALVHELTLMTVDERLRHAQWLPTRSS
jgi:PIN domain nuclease of toxin-antitoxin system